MQVGISNLNNSSRSVGQRIKDASLKDKDATFNAPAAFCEQTSMASSNQTMQINRASRTTVCSSCDKRHQLHQASPIMLSEIQRNTVRIIGQYLRDLGMRETVESLVDESGCRIENPLSLQLRDYVIRGLWNKALDIIEKFRPSISEQQYLTVRVLLLEEKFKDLLLRGEILLALRLVQLEYPKKQGNKT